MIEHSLLALAADLRGELVPPPRDAPDVCRVCRAWRSPADELCWNCLRVRESLARPCPTVIPISLYRKPSLLRDWLTHYKGDPGVRAACVRNLSAILAAFLQTQQPGLWARLGGWDEMAVVPSSTSEGVHPFIEVATAALDPRPGPRVLLRRTAVHLTHNVMSDRGYEPTVDVEGVRILLLDDVYTTGARSQSAASALQLAGADVVAVVVVGRRINPEFNEGCQAVWQRQCAIPFSYDSAFWR